MLETELKDFVQKILEQKCETNYLEIKSAKEGCPKLFDTLSAFSNQQGGGRILFGIDESGGYEICGVYNAADLQRKIMEQSEQMEPIVRPLCTCADIDGKIIVCAEIGEVDNFQKPCYYKGKGKLKGSYIRVGDGDKPMTEYEVYSYEAFKMQIHDELRVSERAEISDIDTDKLNIFLAQIKDKKPNLANLSKEKICQLQGLTDKNEPTLAGIMLFSEYPQGYYPQCCITAVVVPGTEVSAVGAVGERFIDSARIDGTIPQMLEAALAFIRRNMRNKIIIDKQTGKRADKTDYPVEALRELVTNALVHRDYSVHTVSSPITVKMFSDRIEIENPGGLYGRMTLDDLGKTNADTRNPFIAMALENMGITENRFSGIPTVVNSMKENGLPQPLFENDRGVFRATLFNDAVAVSSPNSVDSRILEFCSVPRSRAELEEHFNGEYSIIYLMSRFVQPLIDSGRLKLTIPEKPKSKNQRYYTA